MNRLTASILALGLAAGIGTASAQSAGYYPQPYGQPSADRYGQVDGAYYDYARVVRVDPVYDTAYGYPASGQRCVSRQDTYAGDGYNNGYPNSGYYGNGYPNGYRNDGYANGYGNNGYYGQQGSTAGRTVATVIGGVLGAALGSQVGGGSARYATAAVGSMVGGIAGQRVYESAQRNRYPRTGTVEVCDPVQVDTYGNPVSYTQSGYDGRVDNRRVTAFDVTYEYAGRTYTTRTAYNPGSRMRVRVAVSPG
jgi:uncharacterized protein YcfJ